MLCYAMLCYAMLCYAMLCYAMPCCYAILCFATSCNVMSFLLIHVVWFCVMSCHVYVMLRLARLGKVQTRPSLFRQSKKLGKGKLGTGKAKK